MSNTEFRKIDDIAAYVRDALESGRFTPGRYQKKGEFTARRGVAGEKIVTVMANGLKETENTVAADENGNPDWVVTGIGGEQYVVTDAVFNSKYEPIEGREGVYRPKSFPVTAAQTDEAISFTAPWGEKMNIAAGGYIVFTNPPDIYGIQQAEFDATYESI